MFAQKRLQKELSKMNKETPPGITIASSPDLTNWKMDIRVLDSNPLYLDQTYRLNFKFSPSYPIEAPEVTFIKEDGRDIPMHPHSKPCLHLSRYQFNPLTTLSLLNSLFEWCYMS
ncbi:hypothetical protein TWF694_008578 [Orbilia ellipsospora]|uniref:UBC core domain-containing protein n=1 Tax=Orbilia ellipsospora TaxID=2528407 RepID=A0AAV9XHT8_9PEZI